MITVTVAYIFYMGWGGEEVDGLQVGTGETLENAIFDAYTKANEQHFPSLHKEGKVGVEFAEWYVQHIIKGTVETIDVSSADLDLVDSMVAEHFDPAEE